MESKSTFEKIFSTDDDPSKLKDENTGYYSKYLIINKARIIFELMAGY